MVEAIDIIFVLILTLATHEYGHHCYWVDVAKGKTKLYINGLRIGILSDYNPLKHTLKDLEGFYLLGILWGFLPFAILIVDYNEIAIIGGVANIIGSIRDFKEVYKIWRF